MARAKAISMNKNWEAECDARTLAEAETIRSDKKRMSAAAKAAMKMGNDAEKNAQALKAVAAKKLPQSVLKKRGKTK